MLTALVLILVMTMATAAVVQVALSEYSGAAAHEQSVQAFFLAEAGLEHGLAYLRTKEDWSDATSSWKSLFNPESVPFPASGGPVGTYSVYYRDPRSGAPVPGGPCSGFGIPDNGELDPVNNTWVRVIGRVGRASRTVEFLAHRLTAGDLTTYSASDVDLASSSAVGAGQVEIHGSLYVRGDLLLKAVKTGIYNDRPLFSTETDPPGYCNQLFVKGILDMTKGNATVGTPSQPMWGVHAEQIALKKSVTDPADVIYTKFLGNQVPDIPYPDVEAFVQTVRDTGAYGNAMTGDGRLVVCRKSSPSASVDPTPVFSADLVFGGSGAVFYLPTREFWDAGAGACTAAVEDEANYILKWDSSTAPGRLTFNSAKKDRPVLVRGLLKVSADVIYTGIGTIVVDYPDAMTWAMDSGDNSGKDPTNSTPVSGPCPSNLSCQILASERATQGYACPGQTTMPCQDLAVFIVNGSVRLNGSSTVANQENDVIIVAGRRDDPVHQFLSLKKVSVYGIVITNKLDTSQNPKFYQVPDIANYMPLPFSSLLGGSGGAVVYRGWRELF